MGIINYEVIQVTYEEYLYLLSVFYTDFLQLDNAYQEGHLKYVSTDKKAVWLQGRASKKDCEHALQKQIISTTVNNLLDKL